MSDNSNNFKEVLLKKASKVSKYLFIYGTDRKYLPVNCSVTDVRVDNVWCVLAKCSWEVEYEYRDMGYYTQKV